MKGLIRMHLSSHRPDQNLIWKSGTTLRRCASAKCKCLTTGRAKNLQTKKTTVMCQNCAVAKGIADRGA